MIEYMLCCILPSFSFIMNNTRSLYMQNISSPIISMYIIGGDIIICYIFILEIYNIEQRYLKDKIDYKKI